METHVWMTLKNNFHPLLHNCYPNSTKRVWENLKLSFQNSLYSMGSSLNYPVDKYCLCFLLGILGPMAYLSGSGHITDGQEKSVVCTVSSNYMLYAWDVQEVSLTNVEHK